MIRPSFKQCFHMSVVEPDMVFLLTETGYDVLTGRVYKHLAPLLNGQHTLSDLLGRLDGQVSMVEAMMAIKQLQARGYLVEADESIPPEQAAFWQTLGVEAQTATERLHQTSVVVKTFGAANASPLITALSGMGIAVEQGNDNDAALRNGGKDAFLVAVTDDYLQPGLEAVNQEMLAAGRPWLLVKLVGNLIWIGPLLHPGATGCWACMAHRIQGNRQVESYVLNKIGQEGPLLTSRSALDSAVQMGANLAATGIVRWIVQGPPPHLQGQLLTFDVLSAKTQQHTLVRRPQCPACGDPTFQAHYRQPKIIELSSGKKKFMADGGHRTLFPEETLARTQHHISPILGVVSSLVNMTGDTSGIAYSYAAGHNFALPRDDMAMLRRNLRGRSGGKGMTDTQAKVSAIGEAIERYSGVYRREEVVSIRSSYRELAPDALHLQDILLFSESQYANRDAWNAQCTTNFHLVPNQFDQNAVIDWSPIWSLTKRAFRYVPTVYCYYGHPELSYFYCGSDANGCATGNTMEEAILQGFLELVERDGVALWWYNAIRRPAVDVLSFELPYYSLLQEYYQAHRRSLWVLDITTDLGIPIFAAVSARVDQAVQDIIVGFGAHLDAKIALLRALTEVNQLLPSVSRSNPDGSTKYFVNDQDTMDWLMQATIEKQSYLAPDERLPMKTAADYTRLDSNDLRQDVETCVAIAGNAGMETLVLDQTLPDVGMQVCRVIVPGLRHFWRRLGPGRLYDVPVKLGWLDAPIPETAMNPFSIFF